MDDGELVLPSAGPDPLPVGVALAAVLGYARGRRPFHYRAPNARTGRWVDIPAFAYDRFDRRMGSAEPLGEPDILTAEGLHGRLDPESWAAMKAVLDDVAPLADATADRAAGRPFVELPDDEFSVLAEPGTVGAGLRRIWQHCSDVPGVSAQHVTAALHHRRPSLFPLLSRTTRWQLFPHVREGDSGVEAVIHRELRANRAAFAVLAEAAAGLLDGDTPLTLLRLHDVLLWLSGSLRLTHAVALGQALQAGSRPV
ncbi:DUF6308 family protein [Blastococcus brunescens]|uniref:DUF6308 family protein n=1 Tax=Blastococcus brunescens TaxID=1564165 RepID=A0ABZ1AZM2_9ACTN|nr:DUF6308 family protein [Blastococcus sp. BMG 8361]WRL62260.1 DUF6308 family protein [Blastococcus sp. BMG 8361]